MVYSQKNGVNPPKMAHPKENGVSHPDGLCLKMVYPLGNGVNPKMACASKNGVHHGDGDEPRGMVYATIDGVSFQKGHTP